MSHNPFARSRPNPKRREPRRVIGREILHGAEKTAERRRIFERSGDRCEAMVLRGDNGWVGEIRCNRPITWETMQWSHPRHGPYKDDREGIASCAECHQNFHNSGGKPCARKPGRVMNQKEALDYWKSTACFCGKEMKSKNTSFGAKCMSQLSPQLQYDVMNATGADYLRAMALAEQALLAHNNNLSGIADSDAIPDE